MFKKLKKKIANYLNKLAKANQSSFGNEKLDCCKLNNNTPKK